MPYLGKSLPGFFEEKVKSLLGRDLQTEKKREVLEGRLEEQRLRS